MIESSQNQDDLFEYSFTKKEIRALALFCRKYQAQIPNELLRFSSEIEKEIYKSLSIEDVLRFYS